MESEPRWTTITADPASLPEDGGEVLYRFGLGALAMLPASKSWYYASLEESR